MRYLRHFNTRLQALRERLHLSPSDVARLCDTAPEVVARWELETSGERCYPSVEQLLDLSLHTGTPLIDLLDLESRDTRNGQLELPGFGQVDDGGFAEALNQLESLVAQAELTEDERTLLQRYRQTSDENRHLILQLLQ